MKRPKVNGEKLRDRLKRGAILFAVGAFLIGSVGIYVFIFFMGDKSSPNEVSQEALQAQLQEQLRKQGEEKAKNMPVDQSFIVSEPITELKTEDTQVGTGAEAAAGSTVKVNYKGALAKNGKVFDQGQGYESSLNDLIQAWKEGIPGMKVGGKRKLYVPAAKGYGESGSQDGSIPPNSDLVFEVELVEVK